MSPMPRSDNKILDYLEQLERATPNAPSFDDLHLYDAPQRSRFVPLAGAGVVVAAGLVGIVAVSANEPGQPAQGDSRTETTTTLAPLAATGWACTDPRAFDGPAGYEYFGDCFTVDGVDMGSIPPITMPQALETTTVLPALTVTGWACTGPRAFDGPAGYEYFDECFTVDGVDMSNIPTITNPPVDESNIPTITNPRDDPLSTPPTTEDAETQILVSDVEQSYTVVEGDTVASIAGRYGFPAGQLEMIATYNNWPDIDVTLVPGSTMRIPPGAIVLTPTTTISTSPLGD